MDVKAKFDQNLMIVTALATLSFIIRSTSVVGLIPLLLSKIIYDGCFFVFLIAGFTVAIPLVAFGVILDSLFFGSLTITWWNFVKFNIIEGRSSDFGTD